MYKEYLDELKKGECASWHIWGMKILVTGADGFIGSHLTEELVRNGYEVKAFVYYNSFNTWGWLDVA